MNKKSSQDARRKALSAILQQIMKGTYDSSTVPLEKLTQTHTSARQEYQIPTERDTNNYEYTDVGQMNSSEEPF